jgi:hypothetical protein
MKKTLTSMMVSLSILMASPAVFAEEPTYVIKLFAAGAKEPILFDENGFNKDGIHQDTNTAYSPAGYDINGYDINGFNDAGINRNTGTAYNSSGYDVNGYKSNGFNAAGIHKNTGTAYDPWGYDSSSLGAKTCQYNHQNSNWSHWQTTKNSSEVHVYFNNLSVTSYPSKSAYYINYGSYRYTSSGAAYDGNTTNTWFDVCGQK